MNMKQEKRMKFLIDEDICRSTSSYLQSINYNVKLAENEKHDEYHFKCDVSRHMRQSKLIYPG